MLLLFFNFVCQSLCFPILQPQVYFSQECKAKCHYSGLKFMHMNNALVPTPEEKAARKAAKKAQKATEEE